MKTLILTLVTAVAIVGCGEEAKHVDHGQETEEHHAHEAKHGGDLIALGDHEGFLEVKLDHDAGTLSAWVFMGEGMSPASLDSAPILNLMTDAGPKQLTAEMSDGAWVFADEVLKGEPQSPRFRLVVAGKTYSPEWDHHAEAEGDHEGHDHD